ncbi:tetratricopeptide repeat protein [Acidicapsa dinghuensis]|uniref:Tetratricopeptide repeat protein n=1 Tax=Acidicapsa dinghuensis TaxID=2218256 RepID=A0ABW1EEM4_9BACT|nr:tetratricopeptide repeat protein [Acidicapsa dinghuensis]
MYLRHVIIPALLSLLCAASHSEPPKATSVHEADAKCASCHREIYDSYLKTPMANASGSAAENLKTTSFIHAPSGMKYVVGAEDGKVELSFYKPSTPDLKTTVQLDYFLGSGHLGVTYLYLKGKYLFESPVAWYARNNAYDMKPGYGQIAYMPPALPMEAKCLRCHMSAVQASDAGTFNRYSNLPFLHTGITCEECHGDPQRHVETQGKAAIVNPVKLAAEQRDSVCISCHLEGDVTVERAGQSGLNYRPGDSISKYLTYYVRVGENLTTRGVSEVEQLSESTCKRVSGDKMSCVTCHNPHFTPTASEKIAYYRSKCLSCHTQPGFVSTHHPENQDCTSCHMQRLAAENIPHVAWTDHRILRVPEASDVDHALKGNMTLKAIFSPDATARDQAMAYYRALMEGDQSFETTAWNQLRQLEPQIQNDKEALDALGNLAAGRKNFDVAQRCFERALQLDAVDSTALSNLAVLFARQGRIVDSEELLQRAFDLNPDVPGLAMNLARVQCSAGDKQAAVQTLQTVISYNPQQEYLKKQLDPVTGICGGEAIK